jgi:hypothetical protein
MTVKTKSESIFEEFCSSNNLPWEKITECDQPTPDYKVVLNAETVIVEVKQIDEDDELTEEGSSRIIGDHVREKINDKHTRRQVKAASKKRLPAILLIYNNLDPMQMFGTEQHDFIAAMYGELTVVLNPKEHSITNSYHGRNQSLRQDKNTSFSAVGFLYQTNEGPAVRIYENAFAENKLNYSSLPDCIEYVRIKLT